MAEKDVEALLGEPLRIDRKDSVETWEYFMKVKEAERRRLLGLVPLPDSKRYWSRRVLVNLENGIVAEVRCPSE